MGFKNRKEIIKVIESLKFEYEVEFEEPIFTMTEIDDNKVTYYESIIATCNFIKERIERFLKNIFKMKKNKKNANVEPIMDENSPNGYIAMKDD